MEASDISKLLKKKKKLLVLESWLLVRESLGTIFQPFLCDGLPPLSYGDSLGTIFQPL